MSDWAELAARRIAATFPDSLSLGWLGMSTDIATLLRVASYGPTPIEDATSAQRVASEFLKPINGRLDETRIAAHVLQLSGALLVAGSFHAPSRSDEVYDQKDTTGPEGE